MPDFEDAFRQSFGRIDTMPSPLPPLDGAQLAARAVAQRAKPVRPRLSRVLMAAAAVLLVIGAPVAIWLAWGSLQQAIPAKPAPTPTQATTKLMISPLTRAPSPHEVLVDDPALISHEVAGEGGAPTGFFVASDTVLVEDPRADGLVEYHGGSAVSSVSVPLGAVGGRLVVWEDTYYLLGEELRAFIRQGDVLVERAVEGEVAEEEHLDELFIDGPNLVARATHGKRYLVAGPGPLLPEPELDIVDDGFTIVDGAIDAHLQMGWEPSGVFLLTRDDEHSWYAAYDNRSYDRVGSWYQGFVYQFTDDGQLTATYTLDHRVKEVQVANGRVYALVILKDPAVLSKDTVQVWELQPNPADAVAPTTDPAEDCDLILLGVDPIACTQPAVARQPIDPLPADPGLYLLSVADGRIRCDVDGRNNLVACVTAHDLEATDPGQCEQGDYDPNYLELSNRAGDGWRAQWSGCRTDRLRAEAQQPPALPEGGVLTVGELAVLASPDGITVWHHASGSGFMISGERAHLWNR